MDISDLEDRLLILNNELHSILKDIRRAKSPWENVIENVAGVKGYNVDSEEFVQKLRHSKRPDQL